MPTPRQARSRGRRAFPWLWFMARVNGPSWLASGQPRTDFPTGAATETNFTCTTNGERATAATTTGSGTTTTDYSWDAYGRLCGVGTTMTTCDSSSSSATSYTYDGLGLRIGAASASGATTTSTWDPVSASVPEDINDTTSGGSGPNATYLYGNLLFGGSAPVEQVSSTNVATFLVTAPFGVQGVYSSTGSSLEQALYSPYGIQAIKSGSLATPFAFDGAYQDATGLIYLVNRYYDPATNQFLSVDPLVGETGQPYVYSNDNPLNETDPLGAYACSAVTNGPKQCRTGVSITVVVWGATTATGTTVITATASVTVTNASPNASVTANLNWNGTVDVTVGHAGVTLVPGPPTVVSAGLVTTYTTTSTPMNVGSSSARVTDAVTTTVYTAPPNPPTTSPNWDLWGVLAFVGLLIVVAVFAPEAGGVILEPALT